MVRRRVWVAKDSSRTTARELQKKVGFQGQKILKQLSNSTYITTCCLRGQTNKNSRKKIQEKNAFTKKQSSAYSVVRHDWNFKWDWLLWSDVTKMFFFFAANTQNGFGKHRDKKYPMCTPCEIYCCIFYVVGLYFSWRSWKSLLDTWHHWFYQIPTDKKSKSDDSLEIF